MGKTRNPGTCTSSQLVATRDDGSEVRACAWCTALVAHGVDIALFKRYTNETRGGLQPGQFVRQKGQALADAHRKHGSVRPCNRPTDAHQEYLAHKDYYDRPAEQWTAHERAQHEIERARESLARGDHAATAAHKERVAALVETMRPYAEGDAMAARTTQAAIDGVEATVGELKAAPSCPLDGARGSDAWTEDEVLTFLKCRSHDFTQYPRLTIHDSCYHERRGQCYDASFARPDEAPKVRVQLGMRTSRVPTKVERKGPFHVKLRLTMKRKPDFKPPSSAKGRPVMRRPTYHPHVAPSLSLGCDEERVVPAWTRVDAITCSLPVTCGLRMAVPTRLIAESPNATYKEQALAFHRRP